MATAIGIQPRKNKEKKVAAAQGLPLVMAAQRPSYTERRLPGNLRHKALQWDAPAAATPQSSEKAVIRDSNVCAVTASGKESRAAWELVNIAV